MRLIIVVFVTLLTAGCLSPIPEDARFLLNGKTEEQFRRDSLECERDAIQVANATLFDNGRVFYRRCMWTRGYQQRSEEHTSELQSHSDLVCRLLLEKKKQ